MKELVALGGILVFVSAALAAMGFRGRDQVVGIDLGTTFSVVALKSNNEVTVVPDYMNGKLLLPSVVSFLPNGSTVVGHDAVERRSKHPLHTIFNAKRFIGRPFKEVARDAAVHPFKVTANLSLDAGAARDESDAGFTIPGEHSADRWVSPIDIGAEVVQRLKRSVAAYIGFDLKKTVICVPAKFGEKQIKATQLAFEQAGFKVRRILDEPTAAAVAYNLHKTTGVRHVLVYDIGGGTLDTSLLYMNGKSVSVLGLAGDDHLGGSDFDKQMHDVLTAKLASARPTEQALHDCDSNGLAILAEEAKILLSSQQTVQVKCNADDGRALAMDVTRDEFEEASAELFQRAMAPVKKVLEDQMMTAENVDDVVLVGGASRTPRLRTLLQEIMPGKRLHTEIDPDVTVAYGAANILE